MFCSILINVMDNRGDITVIKFLVGSNDRGGNVTSFVVGTCVGCNSADGAIVDGADIGTNDDGMNVDVFENDGDCDGTTVTFSPTSWDMTYSICRYHTKIQTI